MGDDPSHVTDLLLYRGPPAQAESLASIICSKDNPLVCSAHDVIAPTTGTVTAPRMQNTRVKVKWNEDLSTYQSLVAPRLAALREHWAGCTGPGAASVLLTATNTTLDLAAQAANPFTELGKPRTAKPRPRPEILAAQRASLAATRSLRSLLGAALPDQAAVEAARLECTAAKAALRQLTRAAHRQEAVKKDEQLHSILSTDPASLFSAVRRMKTGSAGSIQTFAQCFQTTRGTDYLPLKERPHRQDERLLPRRLPILLQQAATSGTSSCTMQ